MGELGFRMVEPLNFQHGGWEAKGRDLQDSLFPVFSTGERRV